MRPPVLSAVLVAVLAACAPRAPAVPAAPPRPKVEFKSIPAAEAALVKNPHDHIGKPLCQRCHQVGGALTNPSAIALCVECHAQAGANHPVGVAPPNPVTDLPLLPGGKIACHTCHDPHDLKTHGILRMRYNELCLRCHERHAGHAAH